MWFRKFVTKCMKLNCILHSMFGRTAEGSRFWVSHSGMVLTLYAFDQYVNIDREWRSSLMKFLFFFLAFSLHPFLHFIQFIMNSFDIVFRKKTYYRIMAHVTESCHREDTIVFQWMFYSFGISQRFVHLKWNLVCQQFFDVFLLTYS